MDLLPISSEIRLNVPTVILTTAKKVTSAATVRTAVLHSGKEPLPHGMGLCSAQPVQLYPASLVVVWGFNAWTVLRVSTRGKGMGRSVEWD